MLQLSELTKKKKKEFPTFTPELNIVTAVVVLTKAFVSGFLSNTLHIKRAPILLLYYNDKGFPEFLKAYVGVYLQS